jgi:hypothetical protein
MQGTYFDVPMVISPAAEASNLRLYGVRNTSKELH